MIGLVIGLAVGAAGSGTTTTVTDTSQAAAALSAARAEIQRQTEDAQGTVEEAQAMASQAHDDYVAERSKVREERSKLSDARGDVRSERSKLTKLQGQVSGVRQQVAANTIDGTGTYVVGEDIQPGTYRADAAPGCYWARLSSLNTSDIIDNDNADGQVVVEVLPSDKAFEASDCADFHKTG